MAGGVDQQDKIGASWGELVRRDGDLVSKTGRTKIERKLQNVTQNARSNPGQPVELHGKLER